jgi:hypothetical protein
MDQHLREFGAVRLVLGLVQHQLDRAAQASRVVGDQQRAFAGGHALRNAAPERHSAVAREGVHEAHRRTAFDAVDQDAGERVNLRVIERVQASRRPSGSNHRLEGVSDAITTA